MPAVRKKREAKQPSIDTSKLKEFTGGSSSSKHERRMAFAKRVKKESEDIQGQISSEQEKAGKRSLWSSIGGALGGLAAGIASGGTTWALQGAAVGLGTYLGAHSGKTAAEDPNVGKAGRKKIKSRMFYESEAEKQNIAFRDFETKLNEGILNRSLAAGLLTAATVGGGKLIEKIKLNKARAAAETAKVAQETAKAQQGFQTVMETDAALTTGDLAKQKYKSFSEGKSFPSWENLDPSQRQPWIEGISDKQTFLDRDLSAIELVKDLQESRPDVQLSNIDIVATESKAAIPLPKTGPSLSESYRQMGAKSQLASFTPLSTQAAPSLMKSYMAGLQGMASDYAQKSILAGGAMSLYGYRPEMQELRPIQMITSPYQTQQRTRTA